MTSNEKKDQRYHCVWIALFSFCLFVLANSYVSVTAKSPSIATKTSAPTYTFVATVLSDYSVGVVSNCGHSTRQNKDMFQTCESFKMSPYRYPGLQECEYDDGDYDYESYYCRTLHINNFVKVTNYFQNQNIDKNGNIFYRCAVTECAEGDMKCIEDGKRNTDTIYGCLYYPPK